MSIQAGIHYFDDREVSRSEIEFLLQGLEHLCPDYVHVHLSKSVGMGFRGLLIAPEDRKDQPLVGGSGSVITLDGRLDNRDEVASRLGVALSTALSDAMLALLAYERWGRGCFDLLQGEIASAVWDGRANSLFLFRSLCGTRPLFYIASRKQIAWSSELDDLIIKSGVDPIVNDAYALGYAYYQPDIDESPFLNVCTVPCGTYVEIHHTGEILSPFPVWHPERISTLELRSDEEYEDAWRHQVENAITKKLRAKDPMFCELSGGLDSTTLALFADRILQKMGRDPSELTTASITFELSTTCDESQFIRIAEKARGRAGIHIPESVQQPTFGLSDTTFTGTPNAHRFTPGRYRAIAKAMKLAGARVLLTGIGGDHLFWSNQGGSPELADLLAGWHLKSLITQGREWSRAAGVPLWQMLRSHAVSPIAVMGAFTSWLPSDLDMFPWVTKKAREWLAQAGRDQGMRVNRRIGLPSRRVREIVIRSFRALLSAGYFQGYQEIYFCHPYSNQELIDFVLSLPMNQLARPGQDRFLMRRATRGLLPEPIRTRKSKATINEAPCRVLERERHEIGDPAALEVCQRGYAEPVALARAMVGIAMGRIDHSYALLRLMNIEQWLRSLRTIEARRRALNREESVSQPVESNPILSSSSDPIRHSISTVS
ncbi:MAG TPA: asparagine synthase-related protein [Terriglobales bacterium]|nr:asparagine synthase-related protein [Terriglobales bacterium]